MISTPVCVIKKVAVGAICRLLRVKPESARKTGGLPQGKLTWYPYMLSLIQFRNARRRAMLTEGSKAPAFSLMDDHDHEVRLSDFAGNKTVVLFFFPKADTPG
jgi:hypothetical protein